MPRTRRLGTEAEDVAAKFLREKGFTLLGRRVKTRSGELDVVAWDGDTLAVVEVRQRSGRWDSPESSLSTLKQRRLVRAAEEFVARMECDEVPIRFDLVAVDVHGIRHLPDFFRPDPDW